MLKQLYSITYQKWGDTIIMQLNSINAMLNDPMNQDAPSFFIKAIEAQFETWLMWGVDLDVKMTHIEIYLK